MERLVGPSRTRQRTLKVPRQIGDETCWAAVAAGIRESYTLPPPPRNTVQWFAEDYHCLAQEIGTPACVWKKRVDSIEDVLRFAEILSAGPFYAGQPSLELLVQGQLDLEKYVVVGQDLHVMAVADWAQADDSVVYLVHDPQKAQQSIKRASFELFVKDVEVYFTEPTP